MFVFPDTYSDREELDDSSVERSRDWLALDMGRKRGGPANWGGCMERRSLLDAPPNDLKKLTITFLGSIVQTLLFNDEFHTLII